MKKDFGHDISDECAKRIMDYYNWRKMLHAKVLDDVNRRIEEIQNSSNLEMAVEANSSSIVPFEYDIPEEYNNFSTADSNTKSGQVYAKVRVKIVL